MEVGRLGDHELVRAALPGGVVGDGELGFVEAVMDVLSTRLREWPGDLLDCWVGEKRGERGAVLAAGAALKR